VDSTGPDTTLSENASIKILKKIKSLYLAAGGAIIDDYAMHV